MTARLCPHPATFAAPMADDPTNAAPAPAAAPGGTAEPQAFAAARALRAEIDAAPLPDAAAAEAFRIAFLGSKNRVKPLMAHMRDLPPGRRRDYGQLVNAVKARAEQRHAEALAGFAEADRRVDTAGLDLTRPGEPLGPGGRHPVNLVLDRIIGIFARLGFAVREDREVEDDWHNFTAMNTPADHPARDMQDTFYVRGPEGLLLRTHTSSVQARAMTTGEPPIRIIAPGRVYRNETISARSHAQFHQVEGLYVDEGVSFADLKQTLLHYAREMYGPEARIRMRPSYFPFTEPSAEVDVWWGLDDEHAHRITKGTGWLEILGCGMVDPAVLANCGIDPTRYSGFAFGMGIERQAMLQYRITDIRALFEGDVRFLRQFSGAF